jgi:hypothetical protein
MLHKFKIGTVVNYRPKDGMISTARGTRVAFENELTAGESEHGQR